MESKAATGPESTVEDETAELRASLAQHQRWLKTRDDQVRMLEHERQKFAAFVHQTDTGVFVAALDRVIRWTNKTILDRFSLGMDDPGWIGRRCREICPSFGKGETEGDCDDCPVLLSLEKATAVHQETRVSRAGRARNLYLTALPIRGADGRPHEAMVTIQDVTDLEILRASESLYRLLFERSASAILMVDPSTRSITLANTMASRMTGHPSEELLRLSLLDLHPPEERRGLWETYASLVEERGKTDVECLVTTRDGGARWANVSAARVELSGREVWMVELRDITDRKQAEEALRKVEDRLHAVVAGAPIVVFALDRDGVFTLSEGKGLEAMGHRPGEVVGRSVHEVYRDHPLILENIRRALLGEEFVATVQMGPLVFETRYAPVRDERGEVAGVIGVATDVSDRKQLEEQLRQSQKMEAVGMLAGGVAHDFNNILTAILGHSDLLLHRLSPEAPLRKDAEEISRAGQRAASLTRQLLAFSRRQILEPRIVDLNEVVAHMGKMLQRLIGEDIDLATRLSGDLGRVRTDPGQIEQVVMNLAVNARDAMPHGGRLTIETANVELDEAYARRHVAVRPGPYAMLAVSDTGSGMDEKTRSRVFEPFFTTKGPGKGTGLGLATVYGIVKQSGGNIWIYSEAGHGTTFKIYLPRVAAEAGVAVSSAGPDAFPRGSETILLVEDDESVRGLARDTLAESGYTVLVARHGLEGLEICEQHQGRIDLMLTDVVMPQMGGRELVGRVRPLRPEMKTLYMSGYTGDTIAHHGVLVDGVAYLQKPFTVRALVLKVREVLDGLPPRDRGPGWSS